MVEDVKSSMNSHGCPRFNQREWIITFKNRTNESKTVKKPFQDLYMENHRGTYTSQARVKMEVEFINGFEKTHKAIQVISYITGYCYLQLTDV